MPVSDYKEYWPHRWRLLNFCTDKPKGSHAALLHFPNPQPCRGQHTIEIYFPQFYFSQVEMEDFWFKPRFQAIKTLNRTIAA